LSSSEQRDHIPVAQGVIHLDGLVGKPTKVAEPTLLHLFPTMHYLPKTIDETVVFGHQRNQPHVMAVDAVFKRQSDI